jgi:hypothetical protein
VIIISSYWQTDEAFPLSQSIHSGYPYMYAASPAPNISRNHVCQPAYTHPIPIHTPKYIYLTHRTHHPPLTSLTGTTMPLAMWCGEPLPSADEPRATSHAESRPDHKPQPHHRYAASGQKSHPIPPIQQSVSHHPHPPLSLHPVPPSLPPYRLSHPPKPQPFRTHSVAYRDADTQILQ